MTVGEIAARLKLNDPLVQRVVVKHRNRDRPEVMVEGRRVGKTVETILEALSWLSENDRQITFIGVNGSQARDMERQAKDWAHEIGLDASKIRSAGPHTKAFRGLDSGQLRIDPDAWERIDPSDQSMLRWIFDNR
jgi:hypothetical protein